MSGQIPPSPIQTRQASLALAANLVNHKGELLWLFAAKDCRASDMYRLAGVRNVHIMSPVVQPTCFDCLCRAVLELKHAFDCFALTAPT